MRDKLIDLLLASVLGALVWLAFHPPTNSPDKPAPATPIIVPAPAPRPLLPVVPVPVPTPPRPWPWPYRSTRQLAAQPFTGAVVGGFTAPDGTEAACDLPVDLQQKNAAGRDGAGLCVFASMRHTGRWQNDPVFGGLFDWMKSKPGGGYPEKVDRMIQQYAGEKKLPLPDYVQIEDSDLEILKLACKTGRMPAVTYSYSPSGRYGGQRIAHMVSLFAAGEGPQHFWAICDNNFPGTLEWMSEAEFKKVYTGNQGSGWAIIHLNPPPPPPPHN
jgi:hypothetical protein